MQLACSGSSHTATNAFEEKYGCKPPEWMFDAATRAHHYSVEISKIAGPLGFYRRGRSDPLCQPDITQHRGEVFENEIDYMTPVAADLVTKLLGADTYVTEMPYAGNFRTDLAICEIDREALRRRLKITGGNDDSLAEEWKFLKSYRYLRNSDPMTYEEFLDEGPYSSRGTNRRVWNWLEERGILTRHHDVGTVVNLPDHITAHAVELKQCDWETALEQAHRAANPGRTADYWKSNRDPKKYGYADYCWVVLDAGHVTEDVDLDRFDTAGVGLIALDEGSAIKLVDAQGRSPPQRSEDREHLIEKTMEKIDVDEFVDRTSISHQAGIQEFGSA